MPESQSDREGATPFLLRLFYRQGSFHRPEEFAARSLPPSISLYTWQSCTLNELAHLLASESPSILPSPAIGTRLAFRLIFPDTRGPGGTAGHTQQLAPRFVVKDLGSLVIGADDPEITNGSNANQHGNGDKLEDEMDVDGTRRLSSAGEGQRSSVGESTLSQVRYVVGDYVSCAILPPLPDGSVAPEVDAKRERPAQAMRFGGAPRGPNMRRDFGVGRSDGDRRRPFGGDVPAGDWLRGERLPDEPHDRAWPDRSWGRGGRRRRGR